MISLKLLRYLEEVARSGSIRKAAARLNISSSAVNRHILALEQQLDTPLFERLPTRMRLTASGEVLVAYAQTVDQAYQRVIGRLRALKGLQQGEIRLVSMEGLVNGPLLQLIDDFVGEHRRMLVRLDFQGSSEAIASRVLSGDSDIGIGYNLAPTPALRVVQSLNVEVGVVVAPSHPLAASRSLKLAHCLDYPLATGTPAMAIRNLVDHAFISADLPLQPTVETNSIQMMKQLALTGRCMTFLNPMDISAEAACGELVHIPFRERHFPSSSLHLVVRSKGSLDPAGARLLEALRNRMTTYQAQPMRGGTG